MPGAVTFQTLDGMLKMSRVTPIGTLAFIVQEQALLVRVNDGWQYVALGSSIPLPTEPPSMSTAPPPSVKPPADSLLASGPTLRMAALNEPYTGDMHGVRGADYACYRQARRGGLRGTFRAFLSSRVQNLDSIVRSADNALPVANIRGDILFNSWKEMFAGQGAPFSYQPRIYSFDGRNVLTDNAWPQKIVWHGSTKVGERSMDMYCDAWHTDSKDKVGLASPLNSGKLLDQENYSCNNAFVVLCVEATSQSDFRAKRDLEMVADEMEAELKALGADGRGEGKSMAHSVPSLPDETEDEEDDGEADGSLMSVDEYEEYLQRLVPSVDELRLQS